MRALVLCTPSMAHGNPLASLQRGARVCCQRESSRFKAHGILFLSREECWRPVDSGLFLVRGCWCGIPFLGSQRPCSQGGFFPFPSPSHVKTMKPLEETYWNGPLPLMQH